MGMCNCKVNENISIAKEIVYDFEQITHKPF